MLEFNKPAKNNQELIKEWKNRGLQINDETRTSRYLDFIGYYRLSAYTIPFQIPNSTTLHNFKPNVSFDDILDLYVFDRELRLLIMDAIERIEVAIRTQICNVHSLAKNDDGLILDAFWYLNEHHFFNKFSHFRLLANIEKQLLDEKNKLDSDIKNIDKRKNISHEQKSLLIERAQKENFLRHYLTQYDKPKLPPSWMVMEMLTWGELSHLYAGLKSAAIKKEIATNLGVNAEILESWLKALNSIRNICAHHGRLWNKELGVAIKIPTSSKIKWLSTTPQCSELYNVQFKRRVYSILTVLQSLLYTISPNSTWANRLKALLERYPSVPRVNMGMPINWEEDTFWQEAFQNTL